MNIMNLAMNFVGPSVVSRVASMLGVNNTLVNRAISMALPALVASFTSKSRTQQGAGQLFDMVRGQDRSQLNNLGNVLGGAGAGDFLQKGGGMLGGLLGNDAVNGLTSELGAQTGLNQRQSQSIFGLLGPVAAGTLGNVAQDGGMDAAGLANFLDGQQENVAAALPTEFAGKMKGFGLLDGLGGSFSNLGLGAAAAGVGGAALAAAGSMGSGASNVVGGAVDAAGNALGGVGNAVGNVGSGISGAVGNVGGAVGNVAGNVGSGISGAAGSVGGAVGNVGSGIAGAAGSVGSGVAGGISKTAATGAAAAAGVAAAGAAVGTKRRGWGIWPWLILLALLGALAWWFLAGKNHFSGSQVTTSASTIEVPNMTVGGVNVGEQFTNTMNGVSTSLGSITDAASARAALPDLQGADQSLGQLSGLIGGSADAKSAFSGVAGAFAGSLKPMVESATSIPGVGGVAGPVLTSIVEKLDGIAN